MITQEIVDYKADDLKVMPTDAKLNEAIDKQLAEIKKSFGTDAKYQEALKQANITEEALKERIKPSVIQDALYAEVTKNVKVNEAMDKAYYNS